MSLRFINLTKFPVRIWTGGKPSNGKPAKETLFPPSGNIVRIRFTERPETSSGLVQLMFTEPKSIEGLPEETSPDLRYIVTESVFKFVEDRKDFVYPASVIRERDKSIAHRYLTCHSRVEVYKFFASRGHYTKGKPLNRPACCKRCGIWYDELPLVLTVIDNKPVYVEADPVPDCVNCAARDLAKTTTKVIE